MEHELAVQNLAVECYLLGEMTLAEREAFEEHYFECPVCANDLRAASLFLADAKQVWASSRQPSLAAPSGAERGSFWSWLDWLQPRIAAPAMAALLLVAGLSLSRTNRLNAELEEAVAPRIVSYLVLPPPTRGEAPVLTASQGSAVILQFYLTGITSQGLEFIVKSTDGNEKFRTTGEVPAPGEPVTLSIPRFDLDPGMYTLVVQAEGQASAPAAQYPLEVRRP